MDAADPDAVARHVDGIHAIAGRVDIVFNAVT
ncbi:hypothetical protein SAMN05421810_10689 [Amycolatopsis arida]|uniref:Uncharacterized protein n=1 Tax=Amycolatopsis arida TaxID=587909 RepID=A0A1I5XIC8_9PSEU|nr:hypothetical protein CLV69_102532 [Amycolatopsis arida]SFQ31718.1 hypothetical protein SAMN05421810_10689 [Amycolatopsis arida]